MKGTSHEEIDAAIQAYEALKIRVDQKLVQEVSDILTNLNHSFRDGINIPMAYENGCDLS